MVTALGIDVRRAFTLVFAIGGLAAALAGVLCRRSTSAPSTRSAGTSLLIFAFIVVVIGGLGSIGGARRSRPCSSALVQQYANYYASSGIGDLSVVLLLAIVLLVRPGGLDGGGAAHDARAGSATARCPSCCWSCWRSCPKLGDRHPGTSSTATSTAPGRCSCSR